MPKIPNWGLILGGLILLFVIYSSYKYGRSSCEMDALHGFWVSPADFNRSAGLDFFSIYISEKKPEGRNCYMLMLENDKEQTILINEPATFSISEPMVNMYAREDDCRETYWRFSGLTTDLIPATVKCRFSPSTNKLVLADNDRIYGVLFKDPVLSELERIKDDEAKSVMKKKANPKQAEITEIEEDADEETL